MRFLPIALAGLVAACAGGSSEERPRQRTSVADEVGAIDRAMLVGNWACRALDPVEGAPAVEQTMTYGADGKARTVALVDTAQLGIPARYRMTFAYDWAVSGERITAAAVQSNVEAVDDNAVSGMMAGLTRVTMSSLGNSMTPGSTNVLRLDREELVLTPADVAEAPVVSCRRS